jgi:hypothetical protein
MDDRGDDTDYTAPPRRRGNPVGWVVFFGFVALIMWIVLSYVSVW